MTEDERAKQQWMYTEATRRGAPKGDLLFLDYDLFVAAIAADELCYFGPPDGLRPTQDANGDSGQTVWSDAEISAAAFSAHPGIITGDIIFGHAIGVLNSSTNVKRMHPYQRARASITGLRLW